jgi:enoyl-CoA hydratase/carnithine racemase
VSGGRVTGEVLDGVAELVFDNPARLNAINLAMSTMMGDDGVMLDELDTFTNHHCG